MDCCEVQKLLSAYYDGELPGGSRSAVAEHLADCAACERGLSEFESLSALAQRSATPGPPADLWGRIEERLDRDTVIEPAAAGVRRFGVIPVLAALAALVLVAISIGIYQIWIRQQVSNGHNEMAADFGQYLDRFRHDPDGAQNFLLEKYRGQSADIEQAVRKLGYRPVVASGMPSGFSGGDVYVMDMPCCKCVQCTCRRDDGRTLAIFEQDEAHPGWFGDRPAKTARCGGKDCSVVQLSDGLAASWQQGDRHLTVIGANDMREIEALIRWFSRTASNVESG